jgi:hypothetical protein
MTPTIRTTESYDSNPLLGIGETLEIPKQESLGAISPAYKTPISISELIEDYLAFLEAESQCMPVNSDVNAE